MRIVVNKETIFQMHNCFNNDERLGINFIPVQIYFVKKKKKKIKSNDAIRI